MVGELGSVSKVFIEAKNLDGLIHFAADENFRDRA